MSAVTVELMSIPHYEHAGTIARVAVNRDRTEVRVVVPIARRLQANSFSTVCGEPRLNERAATNRHRSITVRKVIMAGTEGT